MNNITIHNYEAFLLDLSEGNLTGEDRLNLEVFMMEHPELAIDIEDLSFNVADNQSIFFTDKETIKKTETDLVSAEQFIAYVEQQLTLEEKTEVEKSCTVNTTLANELKLYQATIAQADTSVVFTDKQSLNRKPKVIWFNVSGTQFAAAASVALLISLYLLWPSKPEVIPSNTVAHISTPEKTQKKTSTSLQQGTLTGLPENTSGVQAKNTTASNTLNTKILTASNVLVNSQQTTHPDNLNKPDTSSIKLAVQEPEVLTKKEEPLLSMINTTHKTVVEVITEHDDEIIPVKKKQGFWAIAGKTLNNLNKVGVKSVDGEEQTTDHKESYALTLGALNITHNSH